MLHEIKLSTAESGPPLPPLPPHTCGSPRRCLGPLAFHTGSAGSQISLSLGGRRAERARGTFQNGVVFSSRPVKARERIRLRVEVWDQHWEGALRLGFTAVPPVWASPAAMAIPHLTDKPGYWAEMVPDSLAPLGSELCFWVDPQGRVILKDSSGWRSVLLEGVDVSRKLWAMIDVYGQTRAVLLLGSEKKGKFGRKKRRSCPTPLPPPVSRGDSCLCVPKGRTFHVHRSTASLPQQQQLPDTAPPTGVHLEEDCSVCLSLRASVTLSCGHRCLCVPCATRVAEEFGSCPLCRQPIIGLRDVHEG